MVRIGPRYSRRTILRAGAGVSLAALGAGVLPPNAEAVDWQGLFTKPMPDESGKVRELVGEATADERALHEKDRVRSGAKVSVSHGGRCVISLEDGSIFTLFGGSTLELLLSKMREGVLNLLAGAVLLVVNTGGRYLVAGSTAGFGIKGTVVYRQMFTPEQHTGRSMEGLVQIPPGFSDYFCTCHGHTEFLLAGRNTPFAEVNAQYHDAYYLNPANPTDRLPGNMINHTDEEIRHLVSLQEGKKHDISWLRH